MVLVRANGGVVGGFIYKKWSNVTGGNMVIRKQE